MHHKSSLYESHLTLSLTPVPIKKRADASIAWSSPKLREKAFFLKKYSNEIAASEFKNQASEARMTNVFYAEGYGGLGIWRNGGGGRCIGNSEYQIKGAGCTPYLSSDSDPQHRNGWISLFQSLYEVIWTEILLTSAPWGAVPCAAVFELDEKMGDELYHPLDNRSLLVRETPIRIGHFDRSLLYKDHKANKTPRDADRVRQAIEHLHFFLPADDFTSQGCNHDKEANIDFSLRQLTDRLAAQLAFSQGYGIRLMTSGSNMDVKGRILDTTSIQSIHSLDYKTSDRERLSFWYETISEHHRLESSLSNICFFITKYTFRNDVNSLPWQRGDQRLAEKIKNYLPYYQLRMLGYPTSVSLHLHNKIFVKEFFSPLHHVHNGEHLLASLSMIAPSNLANIYQHLLASLCDIRLNNAYSTTPEDTYTLNAIKLTTKMLKSASWKRSKLLTYLLIRANFLANAYHQLRKENINESILSSIENNYERRQSIEDMVTKYRALSTMAFSEELGDMAPLLCTKEGNYYYMPDNGCILKTDINNHNNRQTYSSVRLLEANIKDKITQIHGPSIFNIMDMSK